MRDFPRRLTPPAPIGSLLDRKASAAPSAGKREERQDKDYLALVRQLPCLYCGHEPCEAAHVKYSSSEWGRTTALGKRPHDRFTAPLCADCHRLARHAQHQGREESFWIGIGIDPYAVANRLWAQRRDPAAMRMVCVEAIANREKK